jgi:hypothetical protein
MVLLSIDNDRGPKAAAPQPVTAMRASAMESANVAASR